jgi:hypothetical protein
MDHILSPATWDHSTWNLIVTNVCSFLGGSLVGSWNLWMIEKRRERLKSRREFIQRCREKIADERFSRMEFKHTLEYRYLRPLLPKDDINSIECPTQFLVPNRGESPENCYRNILYQAVEKLEGRWQLL